MVEGIMLVDAVALPLCQSPQCWRDMGTNLVGLVIVIATVSLWNWRCLVRAVALVAEY